MFICNGAGELERMLPYYLKDFKRAAHLEKKSWTDKSEIEI
jgi:hypothetical protein